MHAYATDATDRRTVPTILATIAIALAFLLSRAVEWCGYQPAWYIDAPSVLGFYALLYLWFDRFGWRWRVRSFRFSRIPDLRGTWKATIKSSHPDPGRATTTLTGSAQIRQTWTKLSIRLRFGSSTSCSTMGALNTEDSPDFGLNYEYLNEPDPHGRETMNMHRGTSHLRPSLDGRALDGDYYTGRGRMNFGSLSLELVSRRLKSI